MGGWFSAVCYTFGRRYEFMITICYLYLYLCAGEYTDGFGFVFCFVHRLYRHFDGTVPIGLVDASWGGKTIESFAPPTAMVRVRPRLPLLNSIPSVLEYRNTTQIVPPHH